VIYLAAVLIVAGVALFVAAPLTGGILGPRGKSHVGGRDADRLEHERSLAIQGLRELEFDREMGKLGEADYEDLRVGLENRALAAMSAIERLRNEGRTSSGRILPRRRRIGKSAPQPPRMNFCPHCGAQIGAGHNFCAECGAALAAAEQRRRTRAD
jgi:ribosomal protein L32